MKWCSNDTEKFTDDSNDETDDEPEVDETDEESPSMTPLSFSCTEESSDSLDPAVFNNYVTTMTQIKVYSISTSSISTEIHKEYSKALEQISLLVILIYKRITVIEQGPD